MENETELEINLDETEEHEETRETRKETDEARLARLDRQASQLRKKLGVQTEKPAEKVEEKKEVLDRIDKMILRSEGIKSEDEMALVQDFVKDTGKSVEMVLESRAFKAELKALREEASTQDALPSSSKRAGQSNRNSVEYYLAKGEMPPVGETKLRQEYVNAKIAKTKDRHMFSDTPIA